MDTEDLATAAKLATHEAVCAERYAGILQRLGRLEKILLGVNGSVILGLFAIIWWFITRGPK